MPRRSCAPSAAAPAWRVSLLRIPGIYASDRDGGHPRERLQRGTPVLRAEDDVYTNHIHADDLARACVAALHRGAAAARACMSATTPSCAWATTSTWRPTCAACRARRASAAPRRPTQLSPMQLSFMSESRRLDNRRLKRELRLRLRYPTVAEGLLA